MKIISLELVGYRMFKLARTHRLVYNPTAKQQLILGTNGSGKSSLLRELSPLPARHADFRSGGKKVIKIEHGASLYELTSLQSGNKHSFVMDGVELNEGRTYQVQLRLVKDHFRYTPKIHELLTGQILFTELRPMERREWITELSGTDWTFALGEFNKLKSRARDAQGAFRHQQSRLATETEALSLITDSEEIRGRAEQLKSELNQLLMDYAPNTPTYADIAAKLDALFADMSNRAQATLAKIPECIYSGQYTLLSQFDDHIQELKSSIELQRFTLERSTRDYNDLEAILGSFGDGRLENVENIDNDIAQITNHLEGLKSKNRTFILTNAKAILHEGDAALSELHSIMSTIPDNSDGRYGRIAVDAKSTHLTTLRNWIDKASRQLSNAHERLTHLKGTHSTECPECRYTWKIGVDQNEVKALEELLLKLPERLEKAREEVKATQVYLEEAEAYASIWGRFRTLSTFHVRLAPLFNYILDNDLLVNRPNENLSIIMRWRNDVDLAIELDDWEERLSQLQQIKKAQDQFGSNVKITERMAVLEREISNVAPRITELNQSLQEVQRKKSEALGHIERMNLIDKDMLGFTQMLDTAIVSIKNELLDGQMSVRHLELSSIQKKLSDLDTLAGIVNDLRAECERLEIKSKALNLMVAALSPTEGIIADRLRDAIFSVIEQMNTVIASVWSHELRILECGFEAADLDYKFPVVVESPDDVTADIALCSKGQKEMINIAFKLTAMLYMGFLEYPLFLDEPGEGFDEEHRNQIMSLVRQMLDSGHYSQLFMVSHIATSHGAFLDAQTLVLDSTNITVPGVFNDHAILE